MLQCKVLMGVNFNEGCEIFIVLLLLYYIYVFIFYCMVMMFIGNYNILIINLCDLLLMFKDFGQWKFIGFVGLNILFVVLCNNEIFCKLDFFVLKLIFFGGMVL